jgi:hypothetical protein
MDNMNDLLNIDTQRKNLDEVREQTKRIAPWFLLNKSNMKMTSQ